MLYEKVIVADDYLRALIVKIQLMNEKELQEFLSYASHLGDEKTVDWIKHVHEGDI